MESSSTSHMPYVADSVHENVSVLNITDDDVISVPTNTEALAITRFVVQRVLVPIVTSIGFFGNIISIRVLTHRSMLSSTNCYLTALAVFDLLYLVFSFTLSLNHYDTVKVQNIYNYWFYYGKTLTDICSNVSVCLTVTFSLERLIAVCYPMKGRAICTPQRARIITTAVVVFAIACTTPEFFEQKLVQVTENNQSKYDFEDTEMYKSDAYQVGYYNFLVLTFTVLPLVLLSTFNGLLVKAVMSATRLRKRMAYTSMKQDRNRRQKEQNRITIMLIGVVIVFLFCQFPNAALLLYRIYLSSTSTNLTSYGINNIRIAGNIVNILVLINSSVNFILYSVMSTKFRRVFLNLLCKCDTRNKENVTKTESSLYNAQVPFHFRSRRCSNHEQRNGAMLGNGHIQRSVRFTNDLRHGLLEIDLNRCNGHLELDVNPHKLHNIIEGSHFTPICVRRQAKCRPNCLQNGQRCNRPAAHAQRNAKIWDSNSDRTADKDGTSELLEIKLLLGNDASSTSAERQSDTAL